MTWINRQRAYANSPRASAHKQELAPWLTSYVVESSLLVHLRVTATHGYLDGQEADEKVNDATSEQSEPS